MAKRKRTRRLLRRLGLLLLLFVGLLAAVPTILSKTSLRDSLIAGQLPSGWSLASEQASLGWMSGQTLSGVTLSDADGKPMLTIESVKLSKPLLSLAMNPKDLGKLEIVRPVATLETHPNGSNWEDFLLALEEEKEKQKEPESQPDSSKHKTRIEVEIVDGIVRGSDRTTGKKWLLDAANVSAIVGDTTQATGSAQLATQQPMQQGQMKFHWQSGHWQPGHWQPGKNEGQQIELLAERLPLGPIAPWLARVVPGSQLGGVLSADAQLSWRVDPQHGLQLQSTGRLESRQLDWSADMLQGDRLRWQQVAVPWKLHMAGDALTIEQLSVDSDWVKLDATGSLTLAELQAISLANLPKQTTKISGSVDVAQLATMLPQTLQLREGVRIDAGKLEFEAGGHDEGNREGKPEGERFVWEAAMTLQNVAGTDGQRQIRWQEPVEATVRLRETATRPQVEQMTLNAPFAQADLQTKQEAIEGSFELDLEKLSQELTQFVDMQSWQLRGLGEGTFAVRRQENQQFAAEANVDLTDLHVAVAGRNVWAEPRLHVELQATGTEKELSPLAITSGKIVMRGPRDHLEAELLGPVDLKTPSQNWHMQIDGNGPMGLWAGRLRPGLATIPQHVEGEAHFFAKIQITPETIQVLESKGSVVGLHVASDTLTIDEPRVEFAGDLHWDRQTGSLQMREMQLLGSTFSFRSRDLAIALAGQGPSMARGNIAFRADLERLSSMVGLVGGGLAGQSASTWPRGTAVGQLQLASTADQVQADFGVKIEQLELARTAAEGGGVYGRPEIVWTEPQLEVTGVAKYAVAADRVQLDNLQVNGQTLQLNSSVSIERMSTEGLLQASGLVEYDAEELAKLVASYAGQGVQVQGDRQVRFQMSGPLFDDTALGMERWNATAEAGWSSAGAYGLLLGGGRLQGTLSEGQLRIEPLDIGVGQQGRLTAQPLVRLTPGAELLALAPGPLVMNVDISQEVSETMLKYVAPILAGATRAEGKFSIDLVQAEVPYAHPEQAQIEGRLTAHRLRVSPGPMTEQLVTLVRQIESLTKRKQFLQAATSSSRNKSFLTMADQQVDFKVIEGRVYHRNLEFLIDDVPVRSSGSVGFDQTLALEIEVPIQSKWIEREPALRGLAGQSLKIPVYGTFQKPKINERAVADLSRQLLQGAASQAIGDELNKQFNKLFQ